MAATRFNQPELRKPAGSPRPKGRENSKDTLCRNVLIYGHCRYEDQGCAFNHDPNKTLPAQSEVIKKALNVDSPSFTPATLSASSKSSTISSQAAAAAPFTPRGNPMGPLTPSPQTDPEPTPLNPAASREFTPQSQNYDILQSLSTNGTTADGQVSYESFAMNPLNQALPAAQSNPYLEDPYSITGNGAYFAAPTTFSSPAQPLQYHLYAPIGPHKEDLLPYQRLAHDFFIPDDLRESLQKRMEATQQVMPNSQLPTIESYHTLVALDTNHHKSATLFGYPAWVYKATSSKNGNTYCLRRIAGYRLTKEAAIKSVKEWKRVDNGGVVSVIDAFTTRAFGDSSLIFVTNYHPLSKTLVELHFTNTNRYGNRGATTIAEHTLWNYIVQLASALKAVHSANLAIRCMDPSKVLVTDKTRIRLDACAVLDVIQFEANRPLADIQQEDFALFGRLMLSLGTNTLNLNTLSTLKPAMDKLSHTYTAEFCDTVRWLLNSTSSSEPRNVNDLISAISSHITTAFDASLHANDILTSTLSRELENGRIARLMMKLGVINERPEFENDKEWSEHGDRYPLKLLRDYIFHQVDANNRPVLDMGHIVSSLNKLDAASEEKVTLVSRDEQSVMVLSYRELNKQVQKAFSDLSRTTPSPGKGRY